MPFSSILETPRLTLGPARPGDADQLFINYCGDPACGTFLQRKPHARAAQTAAMLEKWSNAANAQQAATGAPFAGVIRERVADEAVGVFVVIPDAHKVEIHYGIAKRLWGRGLLTEAADAAVSFLRGMAGVERIWTVCDVDNDASRRVLEKLGFQREGLLRKWLKLPAYGNAARDCWVFSSVATDEAASKPC